MVGGFLAVNSSNSSRFQTRRKIGTCPEGTFPILPDVHALVSRASIVGEWGGMMTNQTFSAGDKPTSEQIAQRAYELWEQAGRPDGRSAEHWFEAENELSRRTMAL